MQIYKANYFNACKLPHKLLLLLIGGLLFACNERNQVKQPSPVEKSPQTTAPVININTASSAELEKLPHIGAKTAREIIEHREKFGKFRKPELLLTMRGISDKKFRDIRNLITAE